MTACGSRAPAARRPGNLNLYQDYDAANGSPQRRQPAGRDGLPRRHPLPAGGQHQPRRSSSCAGRGASRLRHQQRGHLRQPGRRSRDRQRLHRPHDAPTVGAAVGVQVSEGKITPGTPTTATWTESPNLDAALCPDPDLRRRERQPRGARGRELRQHRPRLGRLPVRDLHRRPARSRHELRPQLRRPDPARADLRRALAAAGRAPTPRRSPGRRRSGSPAAAPAPAPTPSRGSPRAATGASPSPSTTRSETSEQGTCASGSGTCTLYGASQPDRTPSGRCRWARASTPTRRAQLHTANVSEAPVKHGQICTNGLGCATGGDRSLGDFLQVSHRPPGRGARLLRVRHLGRHLRRRGRRPRGDQPPDQRPEPVRLGRQRHPGRRARAGHGLGQRSDRRRPLLGQRHRTAAGDNLDLTGASLANGAGHTLIAKINVKSLASLTVSPRSAAPTPAG